ALRVLGFAGGGGHGVEADVGEEHDGCAAHHALEAEPAGTFVGRNERLPVGRVDVLQAEGDEQQDHRHLDRHDDGIDEGRLGDADVAEAADGGDDGDGRQVDDG